MKKIGNYLYDEAGICPACGRIMRSVRYYEGEKDRTVNMGTSGRYTHYSTSIKTLKKNWRATAKTATGTPSTPRKKTGQSPESGIGLPWQ